MQKRNLVSNISYKISHCTCRYLYTKILKIRFKKLFLIFLTSTLIFFLFLYLIFKWNKHFDKTFDSFINEDLEFENDPFINPPTSIRYEDISGYQRLDYQSFVNFNESKFNKKVQHFESKLYFIGLDGSLEFISSPLSRYVKKIESGLCGRLRHVSASAFILNGTTSICLESWKKGIVNGPGKNFYQQEWYLVHKNRHKSTVNMFEVRHYYEYNRLAQEGRAYKLKSFEEVNSLSVHTNNIQSQFNIRLSSFTSSALNVVAQIDMCSLHSLIGITYSTDNQLEYDSSFLNTDRIELELIFHQFSGQPIIFYYPEAIIKTLYSDKNTASKSKGISVTIKMDRHYFTHRNQLMSFEIENLINPQSIYTNSSQNISVIFRRIKNQSNERQKFLNFNYFINSYENKRQKTFKPSKERGKCYRSSASSRIIAIADLHGDFQIARKLLRQQSLIDVNDNQIGGSTVLVQLGDLVDRGPYSKQLYELFMKLRDQAILYGGHIELLLGNHELMFLQRNFAYLHPKDKLKNESLPSFTFNKDEVLVFGGSKVTRSISLSRVVFEYRDCVFVHAGVLPKFASKGIENINKEFRKALFSNNQKHELLNEEGPIQTRQFAFLPSYPNDQICSQVNKTLNSLTNGRAKRMVIGHTPQQLDRHPKSACNGQLILLDVAMSEQADPVSNNAEARLAAFELPQGYDKPKILSILKNDFDF